MVMEIRGWPVGARCCVCWFAGVTASLVVSGLDLVPPTVHLRGGVPSCAIAEQEISTCRDLLTFRVGSYRRKLGRECITLHYRAGWAVLCCIVSSWLVSGWACVCVCRAGLAGVASLCCLVLCLAGLGRSTQLLPVYLSGKAYVPCLCLSVPVGENLDLRWRGPDWPAGHGVGLAVQGLGWLCWAGLGWSELVCAGLPVWAGMGLYGLGSPGLGLVGRRLLLCLLVCWCYC